MTTSLKLLHWGKNYLQDDFPSTAWLDSVVILEHISHLPKAHLLADIEIDDAVEFDFHAAIMDRFHGKPAAYLVQNKEFYGLSFFVDERVLIPRPETEDIVELAIGLIKNKARDAKNKVAVADLGCGSGCIGIALLKSLSQPDAHHPNFGSVTAMTKVDFYDISPAALEVAIINLTKHEFTAKTTQSDMFSNFGANKYDLITANLPYVPTTMMDNRSIQSEPKLALESGDDGLNHYRQLFAQAASYSDHIATEALLDQHKLMALIAEDYGWLLVKTAGLAQLWAKSKM